MKVALKKESGITLIALVVTIVVLIILASVGIAQLTGDNGLINKANQADIESRKDDIRDMIDTEIYYCYDKDGTLNFDRLKENLKKDLNLSDSDFTYEEGKGLSFEYQGFDITVDEEGKITIDGEGNGESPSNPDTNTNPGTNTTPTDPVDPEPETNPPDLTQANTTFTVTPSTPTSENVNVTIKANIDISKYTLQCSKLDEKNWEDYNNGSIIMTQNGKVYARLLSKTSNKTGGSTYTEVNNIDKKPPIVDSIKEKSKTKETIQVEVNTHDPVEDDGYDGSGLADQNAYTFTCTTSTKDAKVPSGNITTSNSEYTFENLTPGAEYTITVTVKDKAGNVSDAKSTNITTEGYPTPPSVTDSNVKLDISPSGPTQGNVQVTLSLVGISNYNKTDFTIQYNISNPDDENSWTDYEDSGFEMTKNGKIYVRLRNEAKEHGSYGTGEVKNIDRTNPIITSVTADVTEKTTTTISVQAEDPQDENGYNGSGIADEDAYTFTCTSTSGANVPGAITSSTSTCTIDNLTPGSEYTITVTVKDKAGNISDPSPSSQITIHTEEDYPVPPNLQDGDISFDIQPSEWTQYPVNVYLNLNNTYEEGLTLEYATSDPSSDSSWLEYYSGGVSMSENGPIYARLKNERGDHGNYATGNVTNIDTKAPIINSIETNNVTQTSMQIHVDASDPEDDKQYPGSGIAEMGEKNPNGYYGYSYYIQADDGSFPAYEQNSYSPDLTLEGLNPGVKYTIQVTVTDNAGNQTNSSYDGKDLTVATVPKKAEELQVGDYVYYPSGKGYDIQCQVLYDASSQYGIQVVATGSVEDVTLYGVDGYQNGPETLHNKAQEYVASNPGYYSNAVSYPARCIGSDPNDPSMNFSGSTDENGYYGDDSEYLSDSTCGWAYNGGSYFWVPSRCTSFASHYAETNYGVRFGSDLTNFWLWNDGDEWLFKHYEDGHNEEFSVSKAFLPVFTLNSELILRSYNNSWTSDGNGGAYDSNYTYTLELPSN